MKLTSEEILTLQRLIDLRLEEIYDGPEIVLEFFKPEILQNILKKLELEHDSQ